MRKPSGMKLRPLILGLLAGFVLLFLFRMAYGYTVRVEEGTGRVSFLQSESEEKRNYASVKYKGASGGAAQSAAQVDQKYEKIAEISAKSTAFDEQERQARREVERQRALIQFEQKSGNAGDRKLYLTIGVPPENFDSLYAALITVGTVQAKQITKKDKTNEYKTLNAKRASLEKIRASLVDLKSKGGKIEEYMQLENRLLDIEQQLQALGVSLGDFDDANEFCTIKFAMLEGKEVRISFMHRVKVALEWAIKFYLGLMAMLFFMVLLAYTLLAALDRYKVLEQVVRRNREEPPGDE